jgi:hypothetical protein
MFPISGLKAGTHYVIRADLSFVHLLLCGRNMTMGRRGYTLNAEFPGQRSGAVIPDSDGESIKRHADHRVITA